MPIIALPAAAFASSLLFDMLSLIAEQPEEAHAYGRRAADFMRLGMSGALASLGIELADYLDKPADATTSRGTRKFALHGGVIVVYLLDLAARQQRAGDVVTRDVRSDVLPIGLSLFGLALLGMSAGLD